MKSSEKPASASGTKKLIYLVVVLIIIAPPLTVHSIVRPPMKFEAQSSPSGPTGKDAIDFLTQTTSRRSDPWYYKIYADYGIPTLIWGARNTTTASNTHLRRVMMVPFVVEAALLGGLLVLLLMQCVRSARTKKQTSAS